MGGSAYAKNAAIVENRPGAGGRIALDGLKSSAADGSVLALSPFSCTSIYPHVYKKFSYDPVADFAPVSIAAIMHHGLSVGPMVPDSVKDVKGFIAWAKANPDKANYGSPAAGSTPHFLGALLGLSQNVELKHIPYRGSVPGLVDVMGGQIACMFCPANAAINAALKDKGLVDGLAVVVLLAQGSTPEEMARSQRAEFERWGPLVKRIGFTADS